MGNQTSPVLCIGSALWDIIASSGQALHPGDDVAGRIRRRPGGVALNIALALVAQGQPAALLSIVGRGAQGDALITELEEAGVDCRYITRSDDPTDTYLAIETTSGEVFAAIADCASLERAGDTILTPLRDGRLADDLTPWKGSVIIDGNLPVSVLETIASKGYFRDADLAFVPASPSKAARMRAALKSSAGTLFVNKGEAEILCECSFADAKEAGKTLRTLGARRAIVTDGPNLACLCVGEDIVTVVPPKVEANTTTGAGDVFLAAFIATELSGECVEDTLETSVQAAAKHITKVIT